MKITAFPHIFSKNYHELSSFNGPCPWILLNELKRSMLQRPSGHTKGTF